MVGHGGSPKMVLTGMNLLLAKPGHGNVVMQIARPGIARSAS
jgi:hypothetical protein